MKTLLEFAELSINRKLPMVESCNLNLSVDNEIFTAYEVSIADQDLLFFCDKGTLNYLVDNYNGKLSIELFNVRKDEAV